MGLDQYAYATEKPLNFHIHDEVVDAPIVKTELAYWRKHSDLQGWMEDLWEQRGSPGLRPDHPDFNCIPLELTAADLDLLEHDIEDGRLPETRGFFFGQSDGTERDDDFAFIAKARAELAAGKHVYYDSWW